MSDENDLLIAPAPEEETETMDMEEDMAMDDMEMDMDHMDMDDHDMDEHMMMEEMDSPFKNMMKIAKMMDW